MKLLKELCEATGAPGFEDDIRSIVKRELKGLADTVKVDRMGNVIAIKKAIRPKSAKGKALKVMLAGHMDEIGFVVKHIDDNGFIRLNPLGGFDPKTLIAKRVIIKNGKNEFVGVVGTKPIHIMTNEERAKMPTLEGLFVDVGLPAKTVRKKIDIGDPVTLRQDFVEFGDNVCCKSMDNRVAVWVLIETLRALKNKKPKVDTVAVFTVQEEVGIRGAITSAYGVEPDVGIAVDVTLACDMPGVPETQHITKLGEGTAIKICDSASISNPKLVTHMKDLARKRKITHQMEILPRGGTDAGGIQKSRAGVPVVTLSVPCRYVHSVVETCSKSDLHATVDLMAAFLMDAHNGDFSYS
jgi:endoglucanase